MHPIENYRRVNRWTQDGLAERVGVAAATVRGWERGASPALRDLGSLAKVLRMDAQLLVEEINVWRRDRARNRETRKPPQRR